MSPEAVKNRLWNTCAKLGAANAAHAGALAAARGSLAEHRLLEQAERHLRCERCDMRPERDCDIARLRTRIRMQLGAAA